MLIYFTFKIIEIAKLEGSEAINEVKIMCGICGKFYSTFNTDRSIQGKVNYFKNSKYLELIQNTSPTDDLKFFLIFQIFQSIISCAWKIKESKKGIQHCKSAWTASAPESHLQQQQLQVLQ